MVAIIIVMLVILVVAGLVLAYTAFPHRGEEVPRAPWLTEVMSKARTKAPLLRDEGDSEAGSDGSPRLPL